MKYEEVQADTTEEVSRKSCEHLIEKVEGDFFLEDTGLFIRSLKGFPGVYSSYVQSTIGNPGILRLLEGRGREAFFKTVLTAYFDGSILQFTGILEGSIAFEERGGEGFGYDPIFVPAGNVRTLAEMDLEDKNSISHRFAAVKELADHLLKNS